MALLTVAMLQLLHLHLALPYSAHLSAIALLCLIVLQARVLGKREWLLLCLIGLVTILVLIRVENPWPLLQRAAVQAAFLTAFMVLLALLREGAASSPAVLALGKYLTTRAPGKRYITIHSGAQLLGMFLNFGALTLLGPLIQRGAHNNTQNNPQLAQWRERRQLSALVRGFSWTLSWSPATVSMAITISVVAGAQLVFVCLCGVIANLGSYIIGWQLDRGTGERARKALGLPATEPSSTSKTMLFPRLDFARLLLVCGSLFALALVFIYRAPHPVSVVAGLMLASPIVTIGWLLLQSRGTSAAGTRLKNTMRGVICHSIPAGTPEAITLAAAGFLGITVAALINTHWLANLLNLQSLPPAVVYIGLMAVIPIASNLALPSIMSVTFLGSLYSSLPAGALNPNLIACALLWGWGINLTASPFAGVPLILGRITSIAGTTLSWRWNGRFSVLMFLWCAVLLTILTRLFEA